MVGLATTCSVRGGWWPWPTRCRLAAGSHLGLVYFTDLGAGPCWRATAAHWATRCPSGFAVSVQQLGHISYTQEGCDETGITRIIVSVQCGCAKCSTGSLWKCTRQLRGWLQSATVLTTRWSKLRSTQIYGYIVSIFTGLSKVCHSGAHHMRLQLHCVAITAHPVKCVSRTPRSSAQRAYNVCIRVREAEAASLTFDFISLSDP
jgi:hypothetical protein